MADPAAIKQWATVIAVAEQTRATLHDAISRAALRAVAGLPPDSREGAVVCVGVAVAAIIEAGAMVQATARLPPDNSWEGYLLDTFRGALRGAGGAVDVHGRKYGARFDA
jgi:hypothetical protein